MEPLKQDGTTAFSVKIFVTILMIKIPNWHQASMVSKVGSIYKFMVVLAPVCTRLELTPMMLTANVYASQSNGVDC